MSIDPDAVHRTAKLLADSGEASSIEEAEAALAGYVLQIEVGAGIGENQSRQAAVLTAVNAGSRAFAGGVRVRLGENPILRFGWDTGRSLSQAIARYGGAIVSELDDDIATVCVGEPRRVTRGRPILRATFDGWAGGVVEGPATPLAERSWFVPAGVAAGGIAVAEAFLWRRGDLRAGRRAQGLSLWRPEVDWLMDEAIGPDDVGIAPGRVWVIGLGHLGQAYLWTLGLLPYAHPATVAIMLQDDDHITKANESTGLLTPAGAWRGRPKARALAEILETRGFSTAITERRFQPGHGPRGGEPRLALIGVDNPETRASLSDAGFEFVVDAGLGGGPAHYLDIQTHVFPGGLRSDEVPGWREGQRVGRQALMELPAYRRMEEMTGDRCGTLEVAGRTVAAAFVGATASAQVVAEATRYLLDEHRYTVIDTSLRNLALREAVEAVDPPPAGNPGFARLS
jgi:hypothetical protein